MSDRVFKTTYKQSLHAPLGQLDIMIYSDCAETEIKYREGELSNDDIADALEGVAQHFRQLDQPKLKPIDGI